MSTIAVVYHSANGHTELLAQAIARGAESVDGASVLLLTAEEAANRLEELDAADAIIFGSPTHFGSVSAGMKLFIESAIDRWTSRAWQDKVAGAFTTSVNFSGDKVNTLIDLMIFAMQQGMIFVSLGILPAHNERDAFGTLEGPSSQSINRLDGSIGPMAATFVAGETLAEGDIATGEGYGARVATITNQLARGRQTA